MQIPFCCIRKGSATVTHRDNEDIVGELEACLIKAHVSREAAHQLLVDWVNVLANRLVVLALSASNRHVSNQQPTTVLLELPNAGILPAGMAAVPEGLPGRKCMYAAGLHCFWCLQRPFCS
jgi:hypothetical protein